MTQPFYKKWPVIALAMIGLLFVPLSLLAASGYSAGTFSVANSGTYDVKANATNKLVMQFDLPNPTTDTSVAGVTVAKTQGTATLPAGWSLYGVDVSSGDSFNTATDWLGTDDDGDGVYTSAADSLAINNSATPNAGDTLYNMATTDMFMDSDHGGTYTSNEAWVLDDGDGLLNSADIVLFDGPADILAFQQEFTIEDGGASNDGTYNDGELIIGDNGNNQPDSGDTILTAGKADLTNFIFVNNILFDDSDLGGEYDNGTDDIFLDLDQDDVYTSIADTAVDCDGGNTSSSGVLGVCDAHSDADPLVATAGGDDLCTNSLTNPTIIITLTGEATECNTTDGTATFLLGMSSPNTQYLVVGTAWAYDDANANTSYDVGEDLYIEETAGQLTYSSQADTVLVNGSGTLSVGDAGKDLGMSSGEREVVYLDSNHDGNYASTDPLVYVGDGVTVANDTDIALTYSFLDYAGGSWVADILDMTVTTPDLGHVDVNNNGVYDDGEPIIRDSSGTTDANLEATDTIVTAGTASILTTFPDSYAKTKSTSDTSTNVYDENTANEHTYSAAADTLIGGVAVSAGSTLVDMDSAKPGDWSALLINDAGVAGTWESGSDMIWNDVDGSTYYNADKLTSLNVGNGGGTCIDADISALTFWEDGDGNDTFSSAGDTAIGSDNSAPMFGQAIATGSSVYASASNERTVFVTVDTAVAATNGCTLSVGLPTNGAVFSSIYSGPNDTFLPAIGTVTVDSVAPSGYSVSMDQGAYINATNDNAVSFTFAGAEMGATYNYSYDDTNGTTTAVTGSGTIGSATHQISGIDVSGLDDDTITLSVTLTDPAGNVGLGTGDTAVKDIVAPAAPSVTAIQDDSGVNGADGITNDTTLTISGTAEANSTVEVFKDTVSLGTTTASGGGAWLYDYTATTLSNGDTPAFTAEATDVAGNTSVTSSALNTVIDTAPPSGYSVSMDQGAYINAANENAVSFTFAGAEMGATYNYSYDDTNGTTTAVTGSGTIGSATHQISGIDVSGLDDDTITLTVYLTDTAGNQGANATDTATKDTVAPLFAASANPVIAVQQGGSATSLPSNIWYYYTGDNLRFTVATQEAGLTLRGCVQSITAVDGSSTCDANEFTTGTVNTDYVQTTTNLGGNVYEFNASIAGLADSPVASPTGSANGYPMNVVLIDAAGNATVGAVGNQIFNAVFEAEPKVIDPTINNATTTS